MEWCPEGTCPEGKCPVKSEAFYERNLLNLTEGGTGERREKREKKQKRRKTRKEGELSTVYFSNAIFGMSSYLF